MNNIHKPFLVGIQIVDRKRKITAKGQWISKRGYFINSPAKDRILILN